MNPTECYEAMWQAMNHQEYEEALDHAEWLLDWMLCGGFPPEGVKEDTALNVVRLVRDCCREHLYAI